MEELRIWSFLRRNSVSVRFWSHVYTSFYMCHQSCRRQWKISYQRQWETSTRFRRIYIDMGVLMNFYLKTAKRTGEKHENLAWENLDLRSMFVSYSMCYFGSSYLSSLILNLPMKVDIMSLLTHGTLVNTNEKSCLWKSFLINNNNKELFWYDDDDDDFYHQSFGYNSLWI